MQKRVAMKIIIDERRQILNNVFKLKFNVLFNVNNANGVGHIENPVGSCVQEEKG